MPTLRAGVRRPELSLGVRITIEEVPPSVVYELRQQVLRPDMPLAASAYPTDDRPGIAVFAAYLEQRLIGTATVFREAFPLEPRARSAWRLRGMAVLPEYRGQGVGERLLTAVIEHVLLQGAANLWCNARVPAQRFYERAGFIAHGEVMELPSIGPHIVMALPCGAANTV